MSDRGEPASLRRAVIFMTASSFLVPIAGLLTQPVLARALGVEGRGELAASIAPSVLVLGVATLGLPDALTYFLAKRPSRTRSAILFGAIVTAVLGFACLALTYFALPFLSAGDVSLGQNILLAMLLTIPALVLGIVRGAATGRQMWSTVAAERVVSAVVRVGLLGTLYLLDELTVFSAILVTVGIPIACGLVYWKVLLAPPLTEDMNDVPSGPMNRIILSYGSRIWLGSVASMLLSRTDQMLMVPLASVGDLGIYSVANTVSDVPFLVVTAIAGAVIGVNSRTSSTSQIADTSRLTLLMGFIGCSILAAVVPIAIPPLFGSEFQSAVAPTQILVLAALIYAPGFIVSAGLSAQGRPELRSLALVAALVVNVGLFLWLVPTFGVVGACWTGVATAVVFTFITVASAARCFHVTSRSFLVVRITDVVRVGREARRLLNWFRPK